MTTVQGCPEFGDCSFRYYQESGQLKVIYRDDYVSRRTRELETGVTDPYLSRVRAAWRRETEAVK